MSKLKFKGEPVKKKKRKHRETADDAATPEGEALDFEGWINTPTALHAHGPLYILHPPTSGIPATCLAINPSLNRANAHTFEEDHDLLADPSDVNHVFVCTHVPESETKFTLRSANNRFLAIDKHGTVTADSEARGAQEEFELVPSSSLAPSANSIKGKSTTQEEKYAIRSMLYQRYLSVDEVAGGRIEYRGDADEVGEDELWIVRMQARFKGELEKRQQSERKTKATDDGLVVIAGDLKEAENKMIMNMQARGAGRLVTSVEDKHELKKARKEGRIAEAMLDRRKKLKSDRYC